MGGDPGVLAEFTLASEPGNERKAIEALRDALSAAPELALTDDRLVSLHTAVAEATVNAIEHGNQNIAELPVEFLVWLDPHALVVRVTDQGCGPPIPDHVDEPEI